MVQLIKLAQLLLAVLLISESTFAMSSVGYARNGGTASATATLHITVTILSYCKLGIEPEDSSQLNRRTLNFICNIRGAGFFNLDNSERGTLTMNPDCRDGKKSLQVPMLLTSQKVYICDVESHEKPVVTFSPL